MNRQSSPFAEIVERLTQALERETRAARCGALDELTAAAGAKQAAFAEFKSSQPSPEASEIRRIEREALHSLLIAANENAVVLQGVKAVLDSTSKRLNELLGSVADPGTYHRFAAPNRHVMAARINAIA
jgi:hypothetical protein